MPVSVQEEEARVASEEQAAPSDGFSKQEQLKIAEAAARAVVKEVNAGLSRQSNEEKEAWIAEKKEKRMQEIIRSDPRLMLIPSIHFPLQFLVHHSLWHQDTHTLLLRLRCYSTLETSVETR